MKKLALTIILLFLLVNNKMVMAEPITEAKLLDQFQDKFYTYSELDKCENGFEDPEQPAGRITQKIKKQVKFNAAQNWMYAFGICTLVKDGQKEYMIRKFFLLNKKSALYIIFDQQKAYAIYGDYDKHGTRFYRRAQVGQQTEYLKTLLEEFVVHEKWLDIK